MSNAFTGYIYFNEMLQYCDFKMEMNPTKKPVPVPRQNATNLKEKQDSPSDFPYIVHTVSRLRDKSKEGFDYSGILYTNRLRASKSIHLLGLGFFGPCKEEQGVYAIDIQIDEENFPSRPRKMLSLTNQSVTAVKDEIFMYEFPHRVTLHANKWYAIRFQLDGPETCRGGKHISKAVAGNVKFDFHYGSSQMPQLQFTTV